MTEECDACEVGNCDGCTGAGCACFEDTCAAAVEAGDGFCIEFDADFNEVRRGEIRDGEWVDE